MKKEECKEAKAVFEQLLQEEIEEMIAEMLRRIASRSGAA